MTNFKHLTHFELSAYPTGSLEGAERRKIGKHLLNCADCRKLLPLPSVEKFRSAIMFENEPDEFVANKKTEFSLFTPLLSFWNSHSSLVWSGGTLIILVSFSFLIWSGIGSAPKDVVQNYEINNDPGLGSGFPVPDASTDKGSRDSSADTNSIAKAPTPKRKQAYLPKSKSRAETGFLQNPERKLPQKREKISATRGVSGNCSEEKGIEFEFSSNKENFVFKWKKVPNAVRYHLYISDDEEILIDEYETPNETSFVLRKPLDPLKTYKWKIIITLENGQTVVGPSSKFTVKDFQTIQTKREKKKNSDIRCSKNG